MAANAGSNSRPAGEAQVVSDTEGAGGQRGSLGSFWVRIPGFKGSTPFLDRHLVMRNLGEAGCVGRDEPAHGVAGLMLLDERAETSCHARPRRPDRRS